MGNIIYDVKVKISLMIDGEIYVKTLDLFDSKEVIEKLYKASITLCDFELDDTWQGI